jgi:hypothetical protein
MSVQYPKKYRGGINPAGREEPTIYRDPPSSITTRKYEPVNVADVMYMTRPDSEYGDSSRINEGIKIFARGRNPMVQVDYGAGQGASNPYKVDVVRPPIEPIETRVPISAPHIHQNYSISTNPFIAPVTIANNIDKYAAMTPIVGDIANGVIRFNPSYSGIDVKEMFDRETAESKGIVLKGEIRPTVSYIVDNSREMSTLRSSAVRDVDPIGVTSQVNFGNVIVYDPKTNNSVDVTSNVRDKNYVAVTAQGSKNLQIMSADKNHSLNVMSAIGNANNASATAMPTRRVDKTGDHTQKIKVNEQVVYTGANTNEVLPGYNEQMRRMNDQYALNPKLTQIGSFSNDRVSQAKFQDVRQEYVPGNLIRQRKNFLQAY